MIAFDNPRPKSLVTRRRHAYSLIQALVAISISGVVLATAAQLTHTVFSSQTTASHDLRLQYALHRMSWQFREDVHAANSFTTGSNDQNGLAELELSMPDEVVVTYRAKPGALVRTERRLDQQSHTDEILLPEHVTAEFRSPDPDSVELRLSRPSLPRVAAAQRAPASRTIFVTLATIGRDWRFVHRARASAE